ncbi:flavin reductase family protein [Salaquimonas pukyongi]|uniref:flavin reductase family protein n=1 Tax=Salaquimonas pukyongi TaxID=2712698 RepID=UPI00096BC288|nr:flavin reductase family protein [Salaquimonas pukyongi]
MFYDAVLEDHGLAHSPFKALVAPRPIGWISTCSPEGVNNLAPYSFFNAVSSRPDMVMFSSAGRKDSLANIEASGEFVCNYAGADLADAMNATSAPAPAQISEFELAQLQAEQSTLVSAPRVRGVAAALECRATEIVELKDVHGASADHFMVIGQVLGIYIDDAYIKDGRFDVKKAAPITRLGYMDYARLGDLFEMRRPG